MWWWQQPQRVASVPKFGTWDETDPRSGEGFTAIFNKVKEEKQIGAATVPVGQTVDRTVHRNHDSAGLKSKVCKWICLHRLINRYIRKLVVYRIEIGARESSRLRRFN